MPKTSAAAVLLLAATSVVGCKSGGEDRGVPEDAKVETIESVAPNAAVHAAAGDLAANQGNRAEAIKQFERAVELDPNVPASLYKLATLYSYDGRFDAAIATWQKYVDATLQSPGGLVNLARAHELAGHWKQAEVHYLKAIHDDPKFKPARVNYGLLLAKRGRTDEAEAELARALSPAEVQYNLASVLELRKDLPAARAGYERALALDADLTAARQRLDALGGPVTSAQ